VDDRVPVADLLQQAIVRAIALPAAQFSTWANGVAVLAGPD
jgi:hypothetical protein